MKFLFILSLFFSVNGFAQAELFVDPEEPAEFPGGFVALNRFIADNMVYPQTAMELGISGKCYVKFDVDTIGVCSNFKVVKGVPDCPECDLEAVRLLKMMPKWKPGLLEGKPISMPYRVVVRFNLN
ncbi:energy transducer TonB [Fluviicola sp.]|uniref:energy transducer TonB n=1 Tax=Fluviicola sp. TaxID=1917219 RepID=UPI003D2A23B8